MSDTTTKKKTRNGVVCGMIARNQKAGFHKNKKKEIQKKKCRGNLDDN